MAREVEHLRVCLEEVADPVRAPQMAAYMKGRFVFLGIGAAARRRAAAPVLSVVRRGSDEFVMDFAELCWAQAEREFQYVATDSLQARAGHLGPEFLGRVRGLIEARSWWDTVDALAARTVGPMVLMHPGLVAEMDRWITDTGIWTARAAILHQLGHRERTDAERLFRYVDLRADDGDFFIRKALGWALRQYARVNPEAVRNYVRANAGRLAPLTRREALRHLD